MIPWFKDGMDMPWATVFVEFYDKEEKPFFVVKIKTS